MKSSEPKGHPPTVAIAAMGLLILGGGFFALASVVLPGFFMMLAVGCGLLLFFVAQYFVWGRWLYPIVKSWDQQNEDPDNPGQSAD